MGDDREPVEILTAEQVAELLQLNIDYVRKLSREGTLPAHRLPGGRTFRYFKEGNEKGAPASRPEPPIAHLRSFTDLSVGAGGVAFNDA